MRPSKQSSRRGHLLTLLTIAFLAAACTSTGATSTPGTASTAPGTASTAPGTASTAPGEAIKIGVLLPHPDSPFLINFAQAVTILAAKEGWQTVVQSPANFADVQQFNRLIQDMVTAGIKGIIMQPADVSQVAATAKKAMDQGVFTVVFNDDRPATDYPGSFLTVTGVTQFDGSSGVCKVLGSLAPQGAKMVYIGGAAGYYDTQRHNGCLAGLKESNPTATELGAVNTDWTRAVGYNVTKTIMQRFPSFDILYGASDEIALGGVQALKEANRLSGVKIGGFDSNPNTIQSMLAGEFTASVSIAPLEMATTAVTTIKEAMAGKTDFPPLTSVPVTIITKDNAQAYLQKYKDFGLNVSGQ